eukprot:11196640-Lingulodinium_polyedra.AAC.1
MAFRDFPRFSAMWARDFRDFPRFVAMCLVPAAPACRGASRLSFVHRPGQDGDRVGEGSLESQTPCPLGRTR